MAKERNQFHCEIEFLLSSPFEKLKLDDKLKHFRMIGPRPSLNLYRFSVKMYSDESWLCGCASKNSLFCWPCLLFARHDSIWNIKGYKDMRNITKNTKIHTLSADHLLSMKDMKKFAKHCMKLQNGIKYTTNCGKLDIELHNIKADKERHIFRRFLKVIGVLVKLGYVFDTLDSEKATSCYNSYLEIMKLVASYDNDLKSFLTEKKENALKQYQIILKALSHCMLKEIKREVSETLFVMLMFDHVIDVTSKSYIATSLRYIKKNGKLVERFLHFTEWPELVGSQAALMHIIDILKEFNCNSKLIGYTYDGEMILPGEHVKLKEHVRKETRAIFIHYYGHNLSTVLMQVLSTIPAVKTFFASLAVIGTFFSTPVASKLLESEIKKNSPNVTIDMKWEDPICQLEMVFNYRTDIISSISAIIKKPEEYDAEVVTSASSLLVIMRDYDFKFLLLSLQPIFLQSDATFKIIQDKFNDTDFFVCKVIEFHSYLLKLSKQFSKIWLSAIKLNEKTSNFCEPYKKLYEEIFQIVLQTISERFDDMSKQNYLSFLNQKLFIKHRFQFPPAALARLSDQFLSLFHRDNLKNELVAIYSDNEFVSVPDMHNHLMREELDDIFPTVYKLSKFLATLPLSRKSVPISERIQNFIGSGKNIVEFPLFVLERGLLNDLLQRKSFVDQVIDEFAEKAGRQDLIHVKAYFLSKETESSESIERKEIKDSKISTTPTDFNMEDMEKKTEPSELDPSCDDSNSFLTDESITYIHVPDNATYQSLVMNIKKESEVQPLTVDKNSVTSESLLVTPALIKQEIISFEEEL